MTTGNISSNEEDDLFNFDGLSLGAKTGAAASAVAAAPAAPIAPAAAHASTPLAHVASTAPAAALPTASSPVARPLPAQAAGTQGQAAAQLPLVMPVTAKPASAPSFEAAAQPQSSSRAKQRPSILTFAALVLATLVNVALVGIVWRSMSSMDSALKEVGARAGQIDEPSEPAPLTPSSAWKDLSLLAPKSDEGELALATAAEEIARGEYESARARLYSVLSVIDRFDAKVRSNLASRAQVLAADSFREQADRVEREAAAVAAPGFVDGPKEKHP